MKNDFPYPDFTFNLYTFNLTAQEDLFLPSYKGATFRGAFGYALRKTICTLPGKICQECLLHTTCVYPYIFEPSPETFKINVPKRFQDLPRPFVLRPPRTKSRRILKSSPFNFELVLVGKTTDYLPYFIFTFNELGKFGLGKKRGKFDLIYVTDSVGNQIYDYKTHVIKDTGKVLSWKELVSEWKSPITLNFINPTRLKEEGKL
ncbi:MAG: hypothetical protein COX46_05220, partial [bacterium (Candidatus Ratteibacteria) CG23_combo_of_CG06-09_8_20_14_all_48_7]